MAGLPETERAAKLVRHVALGRTIEEVETYDDPIVYTGGITHQDFVSTIHFRVDYAPISDLVQAKEITGRKVTGVVRYGEVFYIGLNGPGRMPVLYLGVGGSIQLKGPEPNWYHRRNKDLVANAWPPLRHIKFSMHFSATETEGTQAPTQLLFFDERRHARIWLASSPLDKPPISELGFDPILLMPKFEDFKKVVLRRTCPAITLLVDQRFIARIDEILFQARVHPEQRANMLSEDQIRAVFEQTKSVCATAVAVDADSSRFPSGWLCHHRWRKGKRRKAKPQAGIILPSGGVAEMKWITVDGRASTLVEELQKMPCGGLEQTKNVSAGQFKDNDGEAGSFNSAPTKTGKRKFVGSAVKTDDAPAEKGDLPDSTQNEGEPEVKKVKKELAKFLKADQGPKHRGVDTAKDISDNK
ncbi:Formamidopyrimidine-DNA glycosylase [Ceratobasidium theobromae]|uniref:Formamidopyrimidine-DNA glycosylase n=1 Tax=Ceratobasidium theobromae TaxID=1582974 RepID=A0A5N5QRC8_9AGAM|nr:Formamidopyrimidine-DNA glycosylase [Ceratobasidium theobromae]